MEVQREKVNLQRGMNFNLGGNHSVILMSVRPGAPYHDRLEDNGETLIYEGHDIPRAPTIADPKRVDQPETFPGGSLAENGKFHRAAQACKSAQRAAERVRVYEKIKAGIWSCNGVFHLIDSWVERDEFRQMFKFKLVALEGDEDSSRPALREFTHRRIIPSAVKLEVWKRHGDKCAQCGSVTELHFDHVLPYAKGGTSITPENVQLLCARHKLMKRDRIE